MNFKDFHAVLLLARASRTGRQRGSLLCRKFIWREFASVFLILIVCASVAVCQEKCSDYTRDIPMGTVIASASMWANWRGSDGSVKKESLRMFEEAKQKAPDLERPEDLCPSHCILAPWPSMQFHSVPTKFRSEYAEKEKCLKYLATSTSEPLYYFKKLPRGVESLSEWVGEFSQGEGELGRKLYAACDGSCSPRYHYLITVYHDYLTAEANVICGPARDKSDNQYRLSYSYLWYCIDR